MTALISSPGAALGAILVAVNVAIILCALLVLPGGRRPQTAMAWLLLAIIAAMTALNFIASKYWVFYND